MRSKLDDAELLYVTHRALLWFLIHCEDIPLIDVVDAEFTYAWNDALADLGALRKWNVQIETCVNGNDRR